MRYDRTAVFLHWAVGLGILAQFALGWWMLDLPKGPGGERAWWFNLHKSLGITLALFIAIRLLWRLRHPAPPLPGALPGWQRLAASWSHAGLYACMLALPLSGYLGSSFSGYPIRFFGHPLANWGWEWPEAKNLMAAVHETAGWLFAALIALHVGAALWHAVHRDGIVRRMWT
jgi:cytochrome b561